MHPVFQFSGEYSASSTSKLGKFLMIFFFDKEISYEMFFFDKEISYAMLILVYAQRILRN